MKVAAVHVAGRHLLDLRNDDPRGHSQGDADIFEGQEPQLKGSPCVKNSIRLSSEKRLAVFIAVLQKELLAIAI